MKKKSLISIHLLLQYIKYPFFLFYIIIRILLSLIIQLHVLLLQLHQKDIHIHINNIHLIYLINNQFLHHRNLILHQPHLYHNNHIHLYHLFFLIHRFHMFLCHLHKSLINQINLQFFNLLFTMIYHNHNIIHMITYHLNDFAQNQYILIIHYHI